MAAGHSLRPIDLPRASTAQRKLRRIGGFGVGATAAWFCLMGMSASQPRHGNLGGNLGAAHSLGAGQSTRAAGLPSCNLKQKKPLFVGFADGMHLDNFEASAVVARDIVREVKHWACEGAENASVAVPSLQLAFARSAAIRLNVVQFDDASLERAHVLISEDRDTNVQSRWRLDLAEQDSGWAVTRTRHVNAADLAEEAASRRSK